jgi:hypothetical protein
MKGAAIVAAGVKLWAESWLRWGLLTLLFSGAASVLIAAIDPLTATYGAGYWMGDRPVSLHDPDPLAGLVSLVASLFLAPWLYVILTRSSLRSSFDDAGRSPLIGRTLRGVPSVLWIVFLLLLCVLALVVPVAIIANSLGGGTAEAQQAVAIVLVLAVVALAVWIVPRLAILFHVFVGEDERGTHAIRATWRRSKGAWGTAVGVLLLNLLIAVGIALIPGVIADSAFSLATVEDAVPRAIVYALVSALITPLGVTIGAALYLELSARKGELSQASLRRNLARFDAG